MGVGGVGGRGGETCQGAPRIPVYVRVGGEWAVLKERSGLAGRMAGGWPEAAVVSRQQGGTETRPIAR